jgi:hypothetical protein
VFVNRADSLECYSCLSSVDTNCADPFNSNGLLKCSTTVGQTCLVKFKKLFFYSIQLFYKKQNNFRKEENQMVIFIETVGVLVKVVLSRVSSAIHIAVIMIDATHQFHFINHF